MLFNSVILSENQILNEITFENFDMLRDGFLYVGPPDITKALSFPETALHHDVQAARPQQDMKSENRQKSPVLSCNFENAYNTIYNYSCTAS